MIHCDRARPLHYFTEEGWEGHGITQILEAIQPHGWRDEDAMERGSVLHSACACVALGMEPEVPPYFQADPELFAAWLSQYRRWFGDRVRDVVAAEELAQLDRLHVATRLDLLCRMDTGPLTLVELKTGQPSPLHAMQLHAQRKMVERLEKRAAMTILYLQPDSYHEVSVSWNPRTWGTFESMAIAQWNAYQFRQKG